MDPASTLVFMNFTQYLVDRDLRRQRVFRDQTNPFDSNDVHFIEIFRLSKPAAWLVIEEVRNVLATQCRKKRNMSPEQKVLCALHFYGSGTYQRYTANDRFVGLSQASVSRCISQVSEAICRAMFPRWVRYPIDPQQQGELKRGFQNRYGFPGVIGVIDCTHVAIIAPKENEDFQSFIYINRKGFHSINVQLICDADMRILNVNAKFPGSTHDAFIWRNSAVRISFQAYHASSSWLLRDAGYPLEPWLLTPIANAVETTPEGRYNRTFIRTRTTIERCNGVLKSRFRCLLRARQLHYNPEKAGKIINACVVLHNVCRHFNLPDVDIVEEDEVPWGPIPTFANTQQLRTIGQQIRNSLIATRFA